ncbi:hypothetical protein T4B_731 [Trichinella pseudospiralis]|uniref:Uncharacterized protein n=1 Tax=Trichinella pseudospiralis TaxID=6337 RepID=A0A0V1J6W6_TRIPS|nr:hypothetical protein T4B_731 [Trichinella pseudospiralis]
MIRFGRHRKAAVDSKGESTKTGPSDKSFSTKLLFPKDAMSNASGSKFGNYQRLKLTQEEIDIINNGGRL